MRSVLTACLAVTVATACAVPVAHSAAAAADAGYPTKPVRLIVPFSPGGTNDILARMAAIHLTDTLGKQVIVDNRAGAEGIIGTDLAVKARPDGYTLVVISSAYTMNPEITTSV